MNNEHPTLYKRNAGFIAKQNISSRNKILDKMKYRLRKPALRLYLNVGGNSNRRANQKEKYGKKLYERLY